MYTYTDTSKQGIDMCTCILLKSNHFNVVEQAKKNACLNAYKNNLTLLLSVFFSLKERIEYKSLA